MLTSSSASYSCDAFRKDAKGCGFNAGADVFFSMISQLPPSSVTKRRHFPCLWWQSGEIQNGAPGGSKPFSERRNPFATQSQLRSERSGDRDGTHVCLKAP